MDSVEDYARRWAKREKVEVDTLSGWLKAIRSLLRSRTKHLRGSMNTKSRNVLDDPETYRNLSELHDKYVIVPSTDKQDNTGQIIITYRKDNTDPIKNRSENRCSGRVSFSCPTCGTRCVVFRFKSSSIQRYSNGNKSAIS